MLSKNIKVLYPILHYPPVIGGLEQWSQNIAERQPADVEIIVVTGRVSGEPNFGKRRNVSIYRTSLFALGDLSHSSWLYILTALPFIFVRSLILSHDKKVDVFHCHGFLSAAMGFILSVLSGKPFIGTEQSMGWSRGLLRFFRRLVYKKAKLCIAASNAVAEEFKKMDVKNIEIVPNGVDAKKFTSKSKCSKCGISKPHIILSVGRLEKVKGHKYLIEAFARVKKEIPDARLVLVGGGSERGNLEKQAKELGVKDYVQFIGEVAHGDLPHYYHKADISVMPSLSEGFGITAIEAMASGVPVIATRVGSLTEIISDGETGILVDEGQREAISRAVVRIFKNRDFAAQLTENGKKKAAEFDWRKSAQMMYKIYGCLND